jgi:hypothetical protein
MYYLKKELGLGADTALTGHNAFSRLLSLHILNVSLLLFTMATAWHYHQIILMQTIFPEVLLSPLVPVGQELPLIVSLGHHPASQDLLVPAVKIVVIGLLK